MTASLTAIAESLLNPQGRFRTLRDVVPVTDACGVPRYRTEQGFVLFDLLLDNRPVRAVFATDDTPLAPPPPLPRDHPFVASLRLLRREVLLYPDDGRPVRSDLLVEELPQESQPFGDFLRTHLNRNNRRPVRRLLQQLPEMADALADTLPHPRIDRRTLLVAAPDHRPLLTGYGYLTARRDDPPAVALLRLALLLHAALGAPDHYACLKGLTRREAPRLWQALRLQGEFGRTAPLAEAAALLSTPTPDATAARTLLADLARLPFAPMPLLAGLLGDMTPGSPSPPVPDPLPVEDDSLRIDFSDCDEVCPRADTLIRYRRGNRWGFSDRHGRPLGTETFLETDDFYEGRAAVRTASGWGLLRRDGTYALPPDREQLAWHEPDNVATASRDGLWHLYDRCGRQLTAEGADWMGDPSEGRLLIRRGGRFGFIGLDGRPVTTLRFDEAYSFRNGRAAVRIRGEWFQIDPDGHRID